MRYLCYFTRIQAVPLIVFVSIGVGGDAYYTSSFVPFRQRSSLQEYNLCYPNSRRYHFNALHEAKSSSASFDRINTRDESEWESIDSDGEVVDGIDEDMAQMDDMDMLLEPSYLDTAAFLLRSVALGIFTGTAVVLFKQSIAGMSELLFESFADILPKPAFYWPLALYPLIGSFLVSFIAYSMGGMNRLKSGGVDTIGKSVISNGEIPGPPWEISMMRTAGAVATLGSGNSLGPEGPSVEIGASISRFVSSFRLGINTTILGDDGTTRVCSPKQARDLFLAGTAAGVSAGFHAPIAGILFSLEVGNRFLCPNGIPRLASPDVSTGEGPISSDIVAVVLASSVAAIMSDMLGGSELSVRMQGNIYAMVQPWLEFPAYLLLGIFCGAVAMSFTKLRDGFIQLFEGKEEWAKTLPFKDVPINLRPMLGGLVCGVVAVYFPQTLFNSYVTLDGLMSGSSQLSFHMALTLLGLKILLSAWCVGCGLIGGVFAPSLFFGATAGVAFHDLLSSNVIQPLAQSIEYFGSNNLHMEGLGSFVEIAKSPAYSTVGAAAMLGAIFRAPLTASMLMFELTQNHDLVLPVLAATGMGGLVSELVGRPRRLW